MRFPTSGRLWSVDVLLDASPVESEGLPSEGCNVCVGARVGEKPLPGRLGLQNPGSVEQCFP